MHCGREEVFTQLAKMYYMLGCDSLCLLSYSATDVHTVASLLKLYIRELPEPIIPFSKYTQFLSCAQLLAKDKAVVITYLLNTFSVCFHKSALAINMRLFLFKGILELGRQVKSLPQVNYNLLKYICK